MNICFQAAEHAYTIDGAPVPSVTQVLESQNDWRNIPAWQLEAARALGRDVHHAVNLMARGELLWASLDPAVEPYVIAAKRYLEDNDGVVIASEQIVGSKVLGVAGTLDLLMHRRGWQYFVDWKVSDAVPSTVGAQLAAYQQLYSETFCGGRKLVRAARVCVRLRPHKYKATRLHPDNGDYGLFISCLNAFKHRERRRYA